MVFLKCIIHVCTRAWHSELVVWQLECLGWCVFPVSYLCHQGDSPGFHTRRSWAVSLQKVNSRKALFFSRCGPKTTFIRINSGAYLKCRLLDHKTDPLSQNYWWWHLGKWIFHKHCRLFWWTLKCACPTVCHQVVNLYNPGSLLPQRGWDASQGGTRQLPGEPAADSSPPSLLTW